MKLRGKCISKWKHVQIFNFATRFAKEFRSFWVQASRKQKWHWQHSGFDLRETLTHKGNMSVFGIQNSSTSRESWKWNPVMLHSGRRHDRHMHVMLLSKWRTNFLNSWVYSSFIHPITISYKLIQQHYSIGYSFTESISLNFFFFFFHDHAKITIIV